MNTEESSEGKFISALYFAASKDKLNFIFLFAVCSTGFLFLCAEIRDIYSFGLEGREREKRPKKRGEQWSDCL